MKLIHCLFAVLVAAVSVPSSVVAGAAKKEAAEKNKALPPKQRMPGADARLAKMRTLIANGTASGKLTKAETDSLIRELTAVEDREAQYRRSMDKVTKGERKKLNEDITDLHQRIWAKTHNGSTAPKD
jgi:predicted  nucleic acid-binding Zn-ribbon protein